MSKYVVKSGVHMVKGQLLRKGDTFTLKNENFVNPENAHVFDKIADDKPEASVEAEEGKKRGRKPKAEAAVVEKTSETAGEPSDTPPVGV